MVDAEKERLENTYVSKEAASEFLAKYGLDAAKSGVSLADLLKRPAVTYDMLHEISSDWPQIDRRTAMTVETDIKYDGYIKRQIEEAERQKRLEKKMLPTNVDYTEVRGLRLEAAQKLNQIKPETILDAQSISGVNPADITVLMIYFGIR